MLHFKEICSDWKEVYSVKAKTCKTIIRVLQTHKNTYQVMIGSTEGSTYRILKNAIASADKVAYFC